MMDTRLLQGMMIASCVLLLLASAITWADIARYREAGPAARPTPTAPEAPTQEPQAAVLPDAVGAVIVDVQPMLASPLVQGMVQEMGQPVPPEVQSLQRATFIITEMPPSLEMEGPPPGLGFGLLRFSELTPEARQEIVPAGAPTVTVAGTDAYQLEDDRFAAIVDGTNVLLAASQQDLGTGINAYNSAGAQGLESRAAALAGTAFGRHQLRGRIPLTEQMMADAAAEAPYMAGAKSFGVGVSIAQDVQMAASLTLASAGDAQSALSDVQAELDKAKQQLQAQMGQDPMAAMMMAPLTGLLDKIQVSASGADLRFALTMAEEDFQALAGILPMLMMGAMMGGGEMTMEVQPGAGPPPGFGFE